MSKPIPLLPTTKLSEKQKTVLRNYYKQYFGIRYVGRTVEQVSKDLAEAAGVRAQNLYRHLAEEYNDAVIRPSNEPVLRRRAEIAAAAAAAAATAAKAAAEAKRQKKENASKIRKELGKSIKFTDLGKKVEKFLTNIPKRKLIDVNRINSKRKKEVRDFYKKQYGITAVKVPAINRLLAEELGVDVKNIYKILAEKFNTRETERYNNIINNTHFEFTLRSAKSPAKVTVKFNHLKHFENWYAKALADSGFWETDSAGQFFSLEQIGAANKGNLFNRIFLEDIHRISGGGNKHGCGEKKVKSAFYNYKLYNPAGENNNCFFKCLEKILGLPSCGANIKALRKQFGLASGTMVDINNAYKILQHHNCDVQIIDEEYNEELDAGKKYMLLYDRHYYVIENWEPIMRKDNKTKRGLMTMDFETRKWDMSDAGNKYDIIGLSAGNSEAAQKKQYKSYWLRDSICHAYYRPYKKVEKIARKFYTTEEKSSARQYLDFLNEEAKENRTYNIIAHNGSRFDYYFLMSEMTEQEKLDSQPQFRGMSIISLNFRGNLFKDSCCFLTNSLENLSTSFKSEHGKLTKLTIHGKEISSSQLCFYRPELGLLDFMELRKTDREFWDAYDKYCFYDCVALFDIWEKFTVCVNTLIEKISPRLLIKCPLMAFTTIGSHSKKILEEVNKIDGKNNSYVNKLQQFTGLYFVDENGKKKPMWEMEKYDFLCNFKRGGISHCHQAGKHMDGITGVDIASQYPASLLYSMLPVGKSHWMKDLVEQGKTTEQICAMNGFLHLRNVKFADDCKTLKPVCGKNPSGSLNWASNFIPDLYVDTYMYKYVCKHFQIESFELVNALVSDQEICADKIFGRYIGVFYEEKKMQDKYKSEKSSLYNAALRETIKLYLNSLTGKLVENPSAHFSLEFDKSAEQASTLKLAGIGCQKVFHEGKVNPWVVSGCMVYSYSKQLLFEYIRCLPRGSDDVIHIETDGIYFSTRHLPVFERKLAAYQGDYPCMFGENLGNLKIEKTTKPGQIAYFLGKKFYTITMDDKYLNKKRDDNDHSIYRVKGCPQQTIKADGSKYYIVDNKFYRDIYALGKRGYDFDAPLQDNDMSICKGFETLKKTLWGAETKISAHTMQRRFRPSQVYHHYQHDAIFENGFVRRQAAVLEKRLVIALP